LALLSDTPRAVCEND